VESSADLRSVLEVDPEVQLAVVFGSAARRRLTRRSDLDVGVLGVSRSRLSALAVALSRIAGREVDLIPLDTAPPLLRFEIARDGVLLLERTGNLWSDFRARAMVDWWDWAPVARRFAAAAMTRLDSKAH
jgi:predicted nucleotidyltransferase